ncbi:hypothetical protein DSO57_1036734 [Entomophthora muscae]|uniref:Uncharacterized protein n=1 Tax=Entomophthora muscae TaxID=34485 RepID=A0ACC2T9V5_9FUNG|nr:hypothetical protein DSO57_1036734 [Entomophthora muscae]
MRDVVGKIAVYVEIFGLLLNLVTLKLILRQGLNSPDMYLALLLALSDVCLVASKLGLYAYYQGTGDMGIFDNVWFGQLDGLFMCLFISTSVLCIGYLALLRCWAIFLRRKINTKAWIHMFFVQQGILFCFLLANAFNQDFTLSPFKRFFYPNLESKGHIPRLCMSLFVTWTVFSATAVNVAYPAICHSYLTSIDLATTFLDWHPRATLRSNHLKKITVVLRICSLMLIYDLVMLPSLFILSKELIQNHIRSITEDCILTISLLFLVLVNPLTLICLHQDILNDVKSLLFSLAGNNQPHSLPN